MDVAISNPGQECFKKPLDLSLNADRKSEISSTSETVPQYECPGVIVTPTSTPHDQNVAEFSVLRGLLVGAPIKDHVCTKEQMLNKFRAKIRCSSNEFEKIPMMFLTQRLMQKDSEREASASTSTRLEKHYGYPRFKESYRQLNKNRETQFSKSCLKEKLIGVRGSVCVCNRNKLSASYRSNKGRGVVLSYPKDNLCTNRCRECCEEPLDLSLKSDTTREVSSTAPQSDQDAAQFSILRNLLTGVHRRI